MGLTEELNALVADAALSLDLEVIECKAQGNRRIQVSIARDPDPVTVGDCKNLSRAIKQRLEAAGHDPDSFYVEVASPGPRRLLRTLGHLRAFLGKNVSVEVLVPIAGRHRFRGRLDSADENGIVVDILGKPQGFAYPAIREVRLDARGSTPERP
jgi:ribosome maturation factor RimP